MSDIPYGRHYIDERDVEAVISILKSDYLTQGKTVPNFEKLVAEQVGVKYSVAVNSATSALHIACLSLDLGPGDYLWTTPNTFVASANCGLYCGASVDFVDIDSKTYNMDVNDLESKLIYSKKNGKLPKIVIPVHFSGQPCDMHRMKELADEYGFKIIEDASHAIGGKYKNEYIGNCRYSDITIFSFHPVKIITTGEGGLAVTNQLELAKKMQCFRSHGISSDLKLMSEVPNQEIWNYQQLLLGFNYRMTDILAALGISQLKKLNEFVLRRQEIARHYDIALQELPIISPWQHPDSNSSFHLYPIVIDRARTHISQRQLYKACHNQGVIVNIHYIPVYLHPHYKNLGFNRGYCPKAENYFRNTISIPIYPSMQQQDIDRVVEVLNREFF